VRHARDIPDQIARDINGYDVLSLRSVARIATDH